MHSSALNFDGRKTRLIGYTCRRSGSRRGSTNTTEIEMYRMFKNVPRLGAVCVFAVMASLSVTLACNSAPAAPSATEAGLPGTGDAAADGSTLKVHPPTLMSPINDVQLESRTPTLVTANTTGRFVNRTYTYEFEVLNDSGNLVRRNFVPQGASNTSWVYPEALETDTPYRWRVRAMVGTAVGPWSSVARFRTAREMRTPDPPPGQRLPVPDRRAVVEQIARQNPGALQNSCQEHGGNWDFMNLVVDALRAEDNRWGYNCKRGNCGDPSLDVVAYHHLAGPTTTGVQVRTIDIISGHCGPGPSTTWIIHDEGPAGTNGWTSRGRW